MIFPRAQINLDRFHVRVQSLCRRLPIRPPHVDYDDRLQMAREALLLALIEYDPVRSDDVWGFAMERARLRYLDAFRTIMGRANRKADNEIAVLCQLDSDQELRADPTARTEILTDLSILLAQLTDVERDIIVTTKIKGEPLRVVSGKYGKTEQWACGKRQVVMDKLRRVARRGKLNGFVERCGS